MAVCCNNIMENHQSDEKIAQLVQGGQTDLFGVLIQRYQEKIKRYSKKFIFDYEDINDVLQEIFIKAYKNIKSFDINRKFSTWLYRIAHNELVNTLKKRKRNFLHFFDLDVFLPFLFEKNNLQDNIDKKQVADILEKYLKELPEKYREVIVLYYFEDLSYQEISDILKIPNSTVGIRIKRAKEKLKLIHKNSGV